MQDIDHNWLKKLDPNTRNILMKYGISTPEKAVEVAEAIAVSFQRLGDTLIAAFQPVVRAFNRFLEDIPDQVREEMSLPRRVDEAQEKRISDENRAN